MKRRIVQTGSTAPSAALLVRRRRQCVVGVTMLLAIAMVAGAFRLARAPRDPDIPLLLAGGNSNAAWIIHDRPIILEGQTVAAKSTAFRTTITASANGPSRAIATIHAFRELEVFVDGQIVFARSAQTENWKQPRELDFTPLLQQLLPGERTLVVRVRNDRGPPALLLSCAAINLYTGAHWQSSIDDEQTWQPVRLAAEARQPALAAMFPSAGRALLRSMWLWLPVMLGSAAIVFFFRAESKWGSRLARLAQPGSVRWVLIAAWLMLCINNLFRVPSWMGFDALAHMQYIEHIATKGTLPLASQGWQMFQSPLYYLLGAPIWAVLSTFAGMDGIALGLRFIPILCGVAMIEILRRIMLRAFPDRPDLQAMGMVFGATLPINLYIGQMIGNEPLAALMTALTLLLAINLFTPRREPGTLASQSQSKAASSSKVVASPARRVWPYLVLGGALGLALLSKATAVLLVPLLVIWLVANLWSRGESPRRTLAALAAFGIAVLVVSGWYYARNWEVFGKPIVGGWDHGRQFSWWQDPGYRTPADLLRFGAALWQPILAAFHGFWDGLYSTLWLDGYLSGRTSFESRPPWNDSLLIASAPLGLAPSAMLIAGLAMILARPLRTAATNPPLLLAAACTLLYLAAMFGLFLQLPIYSTVKATYLTGLTPCLALLAMHGVGPLMRRRAGRAIIVGLLMGWVATAWLTYFAIRTMPDAAGGG